MKSLWRFSEVGEEVMRIRTVAGILLAALSANAQSSGTFTALGNMITPRSGHTATLLPDGKVLIAGGLTNIDIVNFRVSNVTATATAELFDSVTGAFSPTGNMATARDGHTATLLPNGTVLIAGGNGDGYIVTEVYDPSTGTFTTGSPSESHTATLLANGNVLITEFGKAQLYDPSTGAIAFTGDMTDVQTLPGTALLMIGKVLVAGDAETDVGGPYNFAELYDPATATFARTGPTTTPRTYDTTTLLPTVRYCSREVWPLFPLNSTIPSRAHSHGRAICP
jgi:hypothetical protein